MDGRAWWAIAHWVSKSGTQLSDFTITVTVQGILLNIQR